MPLNSRDVTLAQLRYFVSAAEQGTMTGAADASMVAQSAISTAIANLETTLGTPLFVRRRAKGLQLTPQGRELVDRARAILTAVDEAVLAANPDQASGRLSVGCFRTLAPFYLPAIVDGLAARTPGLHLDVTELTGEQVGPAIHNQTIEIALTYDLGLDPDIDREVLASVPLSVAVGATHPLAQRTEVSLEELSRLPMVLLDIPVSREYFLKTFADFGLQPQIRYRFESYESVRTMVASGNGFTLLNHRPRLGFTYSGTELHTLSIAEPVSELDVILARPPGSDRQNRRAESFASECRRAVADAIGSQRLAEPGTHS